MADYLVTDTELTATANAIRAKAGGSDRILWANGDGFAAAVAALPGGGGGDPLPDPDKLVWLIDDYTQGLAYSYTQAEFMALSSMPPNPSHPGLIAQGWNWSLADAKAYVANYGQHVIGQMYITDDGKTRVHIVLQAGRTSPTLKFALIGTATIDWGDGGTPTTVTNRSTSFATQSLRHGYTGPGEYCIKITVDGSVELREAVLGTLDCYRAAVRRIELGANVVNKFGLVSLTRLEAITIPASGWGPEVDRDALLANYGLKALTFPPTLTSLIYYGFQNSMLEAVSVPATVTRMDTMVFYSAARLRQFATPDQIQGTTELPEYSFAGNTALKTAVIPSGLTAIGASAFEACSTLEAVTIPDSVTRIKENAFYGCAALSSITIPQNVTSIEAWGFGGCSSLGAVRFRPTTPPTTGANAWNGLPIDCVIVVPAGTLTAYRSAANYPSPNTYTYMEETN